MKQCISGSKLPLSANSSALNFGGISLYISSF